jgi:hypothetical protein
VAAFLILALLVLVVFKPSWFKSSYSIFSAHGGYNRTEEGYPLVSSDIGVSSSLLPKEIASQEDFGSFSPDEILKGQNYLDPRAQIGYPETTGGVLRNSNWDFRSEPVNPRTPVSIWGNSTIVPDLMRPQFEIGR